MRQNENHIEIKFFDFDITHDEFTRAIGLQPTHFWSRNDPYQIGPITKRKEMLRRETFWGFEIKSITNDFIGEKAKAFLIDIIVPRIEKIKFLTKKYHGEFSVVQYMYNGCNPGLYFDKEQLSILHNSGLELNVDIYVLSDNENKND